ncbi:hypothetical protein D3C71_1827000 [compost metagenome]
MGDRLPFLDAARFAAEQNVDSETGALQNSLQLGQVPAPKCILIRQLRPDIDQPFFLVILVNRIFIHVLINDG